MNNVAVGIVIGLLTALLIASGIIILQLLDRGTHENPYAPEFSKADYTNGSVERATPQPVSTSTPQPVSTSTPQPVSTSTPQPVPTSTPQPVPTSTPVAGFPMYEEGLSLALQMFTMGEDVWECESYQFSQPIPLTGKYYQVRCEVDRWPYYGFGLLQIQEPMDMWVTTMVFLSDEPEQAAFFDCHTVEPDEFDLDNCLQLIPPAEAWGKVNLAKNAIDDLVTN